MFNHEFYMGDTLERTAKNLTLDEAYEYAVIATDVDRGLAVALSDEETVSDFEDKLARGESATLQLDAPESIRPVIEAMGLAISMRYVFTAI